MTEITILKIRNSYRWYLPLLMVVLLIPDSGNGDTHPDQFYSIEGADSLLARAETVDGVVATADGQGICLVDSRTTGSIILSPQHAAHPFNRGLPSWNGQVSSENSGFKIYMSFPSGGNWSPWLVVGFWKNNIWSNYGTTSFSGGYVDIDYVKLYSDQESWKYKVVFKRPGTSHQSPRLSKLGFFASDRSTTDSLDYSMILADSPPDTLIPTTFLYQYSLDPDIGGSICSPTTVSMILQSYGISVDPVDFAWDTYDPYYHLFGVWPRVVQNASEYGLDGAVMRYRNWSDAYSVLAQGGRIGMSIGNPLYSGHLVMLAGFTVNGNPRVHDPARTDGYNHVYSKAAISHSWFDKGGVAYTFFLRDTTVAAVYGNDTRINSVDFPVQISNYPNPFNSQTEIDLLIDQPQRYVVSIYNLQGEKIITLYRGILLPGLRSFRWNGCNQNGHPVATGSYLVMVRSAANVQHSHKLMLVK